MIVFDVETTGLITNEALPASFQPRIIEIGAVKVDKEFNVIDTFETFCDPGGTLPGEITQITGITDEMLKGAPLFIEIYGSLAAFFLGESAMAAHNARFDQMALVFELQRCGMEWRFPYCVNILDSKSIYPGKLADWAREVKGADFKQQHRALDDAMVLRDCIAAARVPF